MVQARNIQKVLLIFPPVRLYRETMKLVFSPLGVGYIAAVLRNEVEVRILDAAAEGFHHEEIIDENFIRFGLSLREIRDRIESFGQGVLKSGFGGGRVLTGGLHDGSHAGELGFKRCHVQVAGHVFQLFAGEFYVGWTAPHNRDHLVHFSVANEVVGNIQHDVPRPNHRDAFTE